MAVTYQSAALNALYNGTNSGAQAVGSELTIFRTGGDTQLDADIESLDQRIASFESVLIGSLPSGKSSGEFPYDRAGLRREFLDEVTALLIRRGMGASGVTIGSISELSTTAILYARGGSNSVIAKNETTGYGNFANLSTDGTTTANDPRLNLLDDAGDKIFRSYLTLIDSVFAEGDQLADNPAQSVQLVSGMTPLTVDGVTYSQIAQVTGYDTATELPTYNTYLLEAGTETARVAKDGAGQAGLIGPTSSTTRRILLSPFEASFASATSEHVVAVDGLTFRVSTTSTGIDVRTSTSATAVAAEPISPLLLNVPGRGNEFPDVRITASYRYTASNGSSYLIGASSEGKVYVVSLAAARRTSVGSVASLTGLEYLFFYNEARTRILRGQLSYREAVVREIQDDLKRANQALAELEVQSGHVTAQNTEGQPTGQLSSETLTMSAFNAIASRAGDPIFRIAGNDNWHGATEWQANRTNLKNYIDRRSAEAQEATLDYQNTLNRFNNAHEVMAKLQEKLDTLLKAQLRNFG